MCPLTLIEFAALKTVKWLARRGWPYRGKRQRGIGGRRPSITP
jgi:hypothetical protein